MRKILALPVALALAAVLFCQPAMAARLSGGSLSLEPPFNMSADRPAYLALNTGGEPRSIEIEAANQYLLEYDAFALSLIQKAEPPTPVSDAINNMAVLDALFKSAESGDWEQVVSPDTVQA